MNTASAPVHSRLPSTFGVLAIILLVLAASLVGARSVHAQGPGASPEAIFGTVVEIGENTLTVATDDAIKVIVIDGSTTLRIDGDTVDLDAVVIGDAFAGTVLDLGDGSLAARTLLFRPSNAARSFIHIVGVVTGVESGEITLTDGEGATVTIDLPPGEVPPEIGDALTTVAKRDRVTDRLAAHALEKVEAIVDRLEKALERAEEVIARAGSETAQAKLADIKRRIEVNTSRHLGLIDQVKARAGSAPTGELERKFAEAQRRYEDVADRTGVKRPVIQAKGVVREVSAGAIVIALPNGGEIRISLDADAVTENIDGDRTDVSKFVAGTDVVVEYRPTPEGGRSASSVKERRPELSRQEEARINAESELEFAGTITSVQRPSADELTDAIAIVIIANENVGRKVVARVTRTTEIKVNGQESGIDGLSPGQFVEVEFLSGLVASEIKAHDFDAEERGIRGVVRVVDPTSGAIAIVTGAGDGGLIQLRVNGASVIVKDGEEATLFDVEPGDLVLDASRFGARDHVVVRLVLRSQQDVRISGLIAGVDRRESAITVITQDGDTVRFNVTADTRIDGAHGEKFRFADIVPGFRLIEGRIGTATFDGITRHVATRLVVSAPELVTARGEVLHVDAEVGNLVIMTTNGRELSLSLPGNGRFKIVKDSERLDGLRGIERGDLVHSVTFQPLNNTIVKLDVLTPGGTAVRGIIVGVDPERNRLKINTASGSSLELIATRASELRLDGERIGSLRPLEKGDVVVNALYVARVTGNVILKLDAISGRQTRETDDDRGDRPSVEIRIKGVIRSIDGDTWIVADTRFIVNAETEFEGDDPVQGAVASVSLVQGDHDLLVAVEVEVDAPDHGDLPRIAPAPSTTREDSSTGIRRTTLIGLIEEIEGEEWTVGGHEFTVNRRTEIIGEPEIGARAGVVVVKIASGELIALQISVERITTRFPTSAEPDAPDEPDELDEPDGQNGQNGADEPDGQNEADEPDGPDEADEPDGQNEQDDPDRTRSTDDDDDRSDSSDSDTGSDDSADSSGSGSGSNDDDETDSSGSGSGSDDSPDSANSGSGSISN